MNIQRNLVSALVVIAAAATLPALGADFGSNQSEIARRTYLPERSRSSAEMCNAPRSFETIGDENSSFDPTIGCSSQHDYIAMMVQPHDLSRGRGSSSVDSEHSANIVSQYRAGKSAGNAAASNATPINHGQ